MHRHRFTSAFVFSCLLAGCAADEQPASLPACDASLPACDPPYFYARVRIDDVSREVCRVPVTTGSTTTQPSRFGAPLYMAFATPDPMYVGQLLPLCAHGLTFRNTELSTGASGDLVQGPVVTGDARDPTVSWEEVFAATLDGCRFGDGTEGVAMLTGGTWHVIQGGSWGDEVIVEVRDLTFSPILTHAVRYDLIRYVAILNDPIRYP